MMGDNMGPSAAATSAKRLLMLILATGLAACAETPASVGTDTTWQGNLTKGAKFGTATGQSAYSAQQEMQTAGYGFEGEFTCSSGTHILPDCPMEARYLKFQPVQLGQKDHIFLLIENGVVSQIEWELIPVAYLDS